MLGAVLAEGDGDHAAEECWQEAARLLTEIGSPEADRIRTLLTT